MQQKRGRGLRISSALLALLCFQKAEPALAAQSTVALPPFEVQIAEAKSAMMFEPEKALEHAHAAHTIAMARTSEQPKKIEIATSDWLIAEALTRLKRPEEALPLLQRTVGTVSQLDPASKLLGDVLKSRGRAEEALDKVQEALDDFRSAYKIYEHANEPRFQAIALQEIGSIYADARDYPRVLQYYAQSRDIYCDDPSLTLAAANNLGFALKEMGHLDEAEAEFRKALAVAQQLQSGNLQAHIYTNIGITEATEGKRASAREDVARGLAIAKKDTEAEGEIPFLQGVLAKIAADSGDPTTASHLLDQVFAGVKLNTTSAEYRDFHEIASRVYEATGEHAKALAHLKAFKRLDDEGRALAASTNAALMTAQFDFANQNLRISRLKEGQLERDVKLAQSKARLQEVILSGVIIGGICVLIVTLLGFIGMRRSRDQIRAANDQLSTSNTALEKALKAKTEFLATTSHEIRTPLNGILGMAQVILSDRSVESSVRERVQLVQRSGETMKLLVDDMLDLAKIETGVITIVEAPFNLRTVLSDAAKFWEDQAASKGLKLLFDEPQVKEIVIGDESRFRQIVYNLLSNAVKFTEAGEIALTSRLVGGEVVIEVMDTGIGIASDQHDLVFEAFTQVDSSTSRKYGGAGLGLSICKKVCEAMHGSITLQSKLGDGSRFTVTLPLAILAPANVDVANDKALGLSEARVLLLDNNLLSQSVLKAIIGPNVGQFNISGSLEDAIVQSQNMPADLVVVSAASSGVSSEDVPGALRSLKAVRPNLRTIVMLSAVEDRQRQNLVAAGVNCVLLKPITPTNLVAALKTIMNDDLGCEQVLAVAS